MVVAMLNPIYEQRITQLDSSLQRLCRTLLREAFRVGLDARVVQGFRSPKEQAALYAQGRTKPGRIVTNSPAGRSWHEYGMAFDLGLFRTDGSYVEDDEEGYKLLGPLGERIGLTWGGRWGHVDYPHYQMSGIPVSPTAEWQRRLA